MHGYVEDVLTRVRPSKSAGRGGYLRIKSSADWQQVHAFLTEERDAAQAELESMQMPPRLLNLSIPMQVLILTERLLKEPEAPADILAINMAQSSGGYVAERIEKAVDGLMTKAPWLFEVTASL